MFDQWIRYDKNSQGKIPFPCNQSFGLKNQHLSYKNKIYCSCDINFSSKVILYTARLAGVLTSTLVGSM